VPQAAAAAMMMTRRIEFDLASAQETDFASVSGHCHLPPGK
jgi:hypothetical protein